MTARHLLILDCLPDSVHYRRYFESVSGITALERCVSHLCAGGVEAVDVVVFSVSDQQRVTALLKNQPCRIFVAVSPLHLIAAADLCGIDEGLHVVVYRLESLLLPADLGQRLWERNCVLNADVAWATGVPRVATPIVLRTSSLPTLIQSGIAELRSNCWTLVELLGRAGSEDVMAALGRHAAAVPVSDFCRPPEIAPITVDAEFKADMNRLMRIVDRIPASTCGADDAFARLAVWHTESLREERTNRQRLIAAAGITPRQSTRRVPRILYVSHASGYSGAEESLLQLIRSLSPDQCETHALVALEGELTCRLREAGCHVTCLEREFAAMCTRNLLSMIDVLRSVSPDILHLNGLDALPMVVAAQLAGIPIVMHVRNGVFSVYDEYVKAADRIIAVSDFLRQGLRPFLDSVSDVRVIYDEADPGYFRPGVYGRAEARRVLDVPESAFVVALVARFAPNKRHDLLMDAVGVAAQQVPHLHLLLKGEIFEYPDVFQAVQDRIDRLGLRNRVTWIPFTDDIRYVYAAADALTLCSDAEGLGRCVVEAMSMEVPVIVTRGGGTHEIVRNRQNGLVVNAGDSAQLAGAILELARDSEGCRKYGHAGRQFVVENLTAAASAKTVFGIYEDILAGRHLSETAWDDPHRREVEFRSAAAN